MCNNKIMFQLLESPLVFILLLTALIHVQENNFLNFHLTVKIELIEEVYYLKKVFHLLFFKISLNCQNRLS